MNESDYEEDDDFSETVSIDKSRKLKITVTRREEV